MDDATDESEDETAAAPAEKKASRDNFGSPVRNLIARQVAYRCSNPDCGAPTIGPSGEPDKIVDVGVGAHITAAAPGGPRYDPSLTPEQRKHQENAIWLCQTCGKKVDSDKSTHTVAQLRQWKSDAIELAARALRMRDIDPDGRIKLARETRHTAAKRALLAALKIRDEIMAGVQVARDAPNFKRADIVQAATTKARLESWYASSQAAENEGNAALLEVRVVWGASLDVDQPGSIGLLNLLAHLMTWRSEFGQEMMAMVGGRRAASAASRYPWQWTRVFRGEKGDVEMLRVSLDHEIDQVEAWAATYIAGRT